MSLLNYIINKIKKIRVNKIILTKKYDIIKAVK